MNEEKIKLALQIAHLLKADDDKGGWEIGANYFIRLVTHHYTGRLVAVTDKELWLEDAAWIADDGRFTQALEKGEFSEVEPFPSGRTVAIGRGAICDAHKIPTPLPRSQK